MRLKPQNSSVIVRRVLFGAGFGLVGDAVVQMGEYVTRRSSTSEVHSFDFPRFLKFGAAASLCWITNEKLTRHIFKFVLRTVHSETMATVCATLCVQPLLVGLMMTLPRGFNLIYGKELDLTLMKLKKDYLVALLGTYLLVVPTSIPLIKLSSRAAVRILFGSTIIWLIGMSYVVHRVDE